MKKILVIDDQKSFLLKSKSLLEELILDCKVFIAQSGVEGIEIAKTEQPDTILLDVVIPEMDGYEICTKLKANELTKNIPIILLSAYKKDTDGKVKGLKSGADVFLSKPFDSSELSAQVTSMLRIREAEKKLKASEQRYYSVFENVNDAIIVFNPNTLEILDINNKGVEMYGYSKEEIENGISLFDLSADAQQLDDKIVKTKLNEIKNNKINPFEGIAKNKAGKTFWVEVSPKLVIIDNTEKLLVSVRDINQRKQAEEELLKSEEKFRSYIENATDGVFVVNQKGEFIEANQAACEITGYPENEILELTIPELHQQEYLEKAKNHFQAVIKDGFAKDELGYVTKTGENKFWNIDAVKLSDTRFLGFAKDITERKLTEEKLKESESRFNRISANANEVIFKINTQKQSYELITENVVNILGYSAQEFYNNPALGKQIICEDDIIRVELLWNNMLKYGISQQFECSMIHKSGKVVWLHQNNVIVKDDEGVITAIEGSFYDITERKQAEEALRESEERLNQAQAIGQVGAWDWNPNTGNLIWSEETFSILGLSSQKDTPSFELFLDLIHEEDRQDIEQAVEAALRDGQPYDVDCRIVRRNGSECVTNARGKVLFDDGGKPIQMIGTFQDITERKLAEDALRKSEIQFKNLFNSNRDGYIIVMGDGEILDANPRLSDMLGYSKDELIKRNFWKLTPEKWSEWELNVQGKKLLEQSYTDLYEKEYIRKDNSVFPVEIQAFILEKGKDIESTKIGAFVRDITERKQAEKALIDSESNLRQIIDLVPHFIFVKDEVGKFQIVNKAVAVAYGVTVEDIKGKYDMDFASNKNDAAIFIKDDLEVINSGKQKFIPEEQITDSKGNIRFLETTKIPFNTSITEKRTILGVSVDITERKMSEERIKQQNIFLNHVLESLSHPFHVINVEDYTIELSNSALGEINVDQKPTCHKYAHNNDEPCGSFEHPCPLEIVKKTKKSCVVEHIHFDKNGEKINVEMQAYPIFDKAGNVVQMIEYSIDITERKKAENALKSSEDRLSIIFESAPDAYYMNDLKGSFIDGNKAAEELLGYKKEELIGKSFLNLKLISPQQTVLASKLLVKSLMGKPTGPDEFLLNRKDGSQISAEIRTYPVLIENKTVILGIARDITKRKQAEEENLKLSTAVTQSPAVIVITNLKGNIEYVNPKFTELTGYSFEEAKGENVTILRSYEQSDEIYKEFWGTISSGKTWYGEFHNKKKNGELFWEAASISPIFDKKGKIINYIKVAEDISERKRMEIVQQIIHNISNAVITTDNLDEFISIVRNELDRLIDAANFYVALYDEETDIFDLVFHKDRNDEGESFPAGKTLTAYVVKTKKPLLATKKVIKKLEKSGEVESFGVDAEVWLGVPLIIKGKIIGVYAVQSYDNEKAYNKSDLKMLETISHQISISLERKKNDQEMKVALERAQESDRLKSAFLTNMSHEIRTPMNGILGFTGLLKDPQLTGDEKEDYIQVIEKSGDRMLNTITDIIDISRIESGQVEVVNTEVSLNNILNEQYEIFNPDAQSKGLELNYKPTLLDKEATIVTDKHKLEGILTNLIKNAIKFTKHGNISFGYTLKKEKNFEGLEFFVKDTGIGIPSNRISAIFNRFEQADIEDTQVFEGSGLGLAISKSYVEMLGGNISVTSEEGIGSTFVFSIPYTKPSTKESEAKGSTNKNPQVSLNKLSAIVAEDDETSRMLLEAILENEFHKITYTETGKETVDKFKENPETNIILMDLKMLDMSGYEATREIRKFNKDVVIIAQTAYGLSGDREKAIEAGCDDYISKPFKKELLFEKIMLHLSKRSI